MTVRVLVVDDSAVTRAVVRQHLETEDAEIHEAADGLEAVGVLATFEPDVVLCDVEMPGLDGFGVLAHVRGDARLAGVPFVFLTGRTDARDVAEGLRLGADDYLRKPFEAVELIARVRVAARTKRLQDELRARNEELESLVSTDPLTRVRNRRHLMTELDRQLARARRHGIGLGTVLLDVDHFKAVNDTHGHAAGDAVLVELAMRLRHGVRGEDALGRWGGEEFLVVCSDAPAADVALIAERMRASVCADTVTIPGGGGEVAVTASVGWSAWQPGDDAQSLLARADHALYAAKAAGRDAVRGG